MFFLTWMYIKLTLANSFNRPILTTFELQLQSTPWANKTKYSRMLEVKFVKIAFKRSEPLRSI